VPYKRSILSMCDLLQALAQVGGLKSLPRTGWLRKGIVNPESVAAHSHRAAVMAILFAADLGVDGDRLLRMMIVHDLPESDPAVGDITPFCGVDPDEKRRRERAAMQRLADALPGGDELLRLWVEYDEGQTPEADAAHQLDALEMALQAREYESAWGVDLSEFRASARSKVRHPTLVRLLDQIDRDGPRPQSPTSPSPGPERS
jgi:putative hydrolases of HD superfamily